MERILLEEFHAKLKGQGVSTREHAAVKCPICGTVQSMASLLAAGAKPDKVENMVGFSCEGRLTDAGPWPSRSDRSQKAKKRRGVRGCDWTLGGLLRLHELEVEMPNGVVHPTFAPATPEEAQALEAMLKEAAK